MKKSLMTLVVLALSTSTAHADSPSFTVRSHPGEGRVRVTIEAASGYSAFAGFGISGDNPYIPWGHATPVDASVGIGWLVGEARNTIVGVRVHGAYTPFFSSDGDTDYVNKEYSPREGQLFMASGHVGVYLLKPWFYASAGIGACYNGAYNALNQVLPEVQLVGGLRVPVTHGLAFTLGGELDTSIIWNRVGARAGVQVTF